jgi:hypothetical protein
MDVRKELESNYTEIKDLSKKVKERLKELLENADSRQFRALVYDKELTQLLSGFSNLERLKLEILKQLRDIEEKSKEQNEDYNNSTTHNLSKFFFFCANYFNFKIF